jgi:hypothetical protein
MSNFTVIKGDTIRAYDFKPMVGREDAFVEGEVLDCADTTNGYQAYKIRVGKDSWDSHRVGEIVFVPWRVSFNEFQGRIINLSR